MATFVSDDNSLHQLISSVAASKEIIIGLCVLALGELVVDPLGQRGDSRVSLMCPLSPPLPPPVLSMILMLIIRYISAILVWILTSLVVLGSLGEVTSCPPLSEIRCGTQDVHLCFCLSGDQRPVVALHRPPSLQERHVGKNEKGLQGGGGVPPGGQADAARLRRRRHRLHGKDELP